MKTNFLTTTILAISILSLNSSFAGELKCTGGYCIVDLSKDSPIVKKKEVKKEIIVNEGYSTILIDNIETIVFTKEKYVMTNDEIDEYALDSILHDLVVSSLDRTHLPDSDYYCEDNLKPVEVVGVENTYECA